MKEDNKIKSYANSYGEANIKTKNLLINFVAILLFLFIIPNIIMIGVYGFFPDIQELKNEVIESVVRATVYILSELDGMMVYIKSVRKDKLFKRPWIMYIMTGFDIFTIIFIATQYHITVITTDSDTGLGCAILFVIAVKIKIALNIILLIIYLWKIIKHIWLTKKETLIGLFSSLHHC